MTLVLDRSPSPARPLRLTIVDDNPFVRTGAGIRARAATFHRFVEAVAETGPFGSVAYCIPVAELRPGEAEPVLPPVDEHHLTIVPTAPFTGIAGYLLRLPLMWWRNSRSLVPAIRDSDLVWIKAPASNALLAAWACRTAGVPRFTYIVSSARAVVEGQERRGFDGLAAGIAASFYDAVTAWLARSGPALVLDGELFTSVVDEADAAETPLEMSEHPAHLPWRIAWAGRLAGEKGLGDLLGAVAGLRIRGRALELLIIGDGPQRPQLEERAVRLGLTDAIEWAGYIGDPSEYLARLRTADLFVLPSRAEGVPKVLVEAMAAGVPVIATRSGATAAVCGDGSRGLLVDPGDAEALSRAIVLTIDDPRGRAARRSRALLWAWEHTRRAQARRLLRWIAGAFPALPFPGTTRSAGEAPGRILPEMLETQDERA
jgi:glycosyltransferase involved in cell wall biosynthesis